MALDTTSHDVFRGTDGIDLPPDISREIWQSAVEESAIMRLAQRVYLPGRGIAIPIIASDGEAQLVNEAAEKPVSNPELDNEVMIPVKIAMIQTFSNEFRRDLSRVYDALRRRAPYAVAKKFDQLAFHGTSNPTGFGTLATATSISLDPDVYDGLVEAKAGVATAGGMLNGWAFAPQGEVALLGALDGVQRPLFLNSATNDGSVGRVLGAPVHYSTAAFQAGTPNTVGIAGDWNMAYYGMVENITIKFSDQATVNDGTAQINLWQRNMFALLVECEIGFQARPEYFRRLTLPAS